MKNVEARFWAKVDRNAPGGCWEWTAYKTFRGYGMFRLTGTGTMKRAHRVAWRLVNGPIPEGMWVLHHCDNPSCVNPKHLFLGTPKDNAQDMIKKGRQGDNRGENAGGAKLTAEDVRAIRREYARGGVTQRALARRYGVSKGSIWYIVNYGTWKHLDEQETNR